MKTRGLIITSYANTAWYLIHALLGAILGFITSCIFLALYYGTSYDMPVTDAFRMRSALIATALLVAAVVACYFYKTILAWIKKSFAEEKA